MRITDQESQAIKEIIAQYDPKAEIYLFGSRADDNSRGGDIDLLILSKIITEYNRREIRIKFFERLGEHIAHEYISERIQLLHQEILERTPKLLELIARAIDYCRRYR